MKVISDPKNKRQGTKKLYTCEHVISGNTTHEDGFVSWHTADHQLWLFRATSLREATAKAQMAIADETVVYKNIYGEDVSWPLEGRLKIRLLAKDSELEDGIEVRYEMKDHPKYDPLDDERYEHMDVPPRQE